VVLHVELENATKKGVTARRCLIANRLDTTCKAIAIYRYVSKIYWKKPFDNLKIEKVI
jgi:hypothetical protein